MIEKLAMGNYGLYVWSCYALTLIVVVLCSVQASRRHRAVYSDIVRRLKLKES
ncbi:MAG: heme exporter protein CcmD [Woeseia sp.]